MKLMRWLFVIVLLAGYAGAESQPESLSVMGFADELFRQGDYYRAITEYERFIFLNPKASQVAGAKMQIGMSYYRGSKWEAARDWFNGVKEGYEAQAEGREGWLMLAKTHYQMRQYAVAERLLDEYIRRFPGDERVGDAWIMKGICQARFGNTPWARESFSSVPTNSPRRADVDSLVGFADRLQDVRLKSPNVAAGLSAVLPGAGQLYVGRPRDAVVSFLVNGVTIAGMVAAFQNDEEVLGGLFALLESSWYFGNIYNASSGAHKYNARQRNAVFEQFEVNCGLLRDQQDGTLLPGVGVKVKF
jgi:tetratricopeptide (TPR) repeat protein